MYRLQHDPPREQEVSECVACKGGGVSRRNDVNGLSLSGEEGVNLSQGKGAEEARVPAGDGMGDGSYASEDALAENSRQWRRIHSRSRMGSLEPTRNRVNVEKKNINCYYIIML